MMDRSKRRGEPAKDSAAPEVPTPQGSNPLADASILTPPRSPEESATAASMQPPEHSAAQSQSHRDDLCLVRQVLQGEREPLDRLIERFRCVPRILNTINHKHGRILTDSDLSDLSQDVVVLLWEKLRTFEGRATLETWAYRHALFASLNRFRKVARRRRLQSGSFEATVESVAAPQVPQVGDHEEVEQRLEELGPPQADVIRLKHFEERTFEEIGAILGIPANTAKTHYYRGLQWLRRHLRAPGDGD